MNIHVYSFVTGAPQSTFFFMSF